MTTRPVVLALVLSLSTAACGSGADKPSDAAGSAQPAATASASAAVPAAPPVPAGVAAVRAGKLVHPGTKKELKLVETPLSKCFGFKGYSMMLPEGASQETVVGARACGVFLPDSKKKFGLMIMTDEVKVKMWQRTDLENVKAKHLDEQDAFVFEVEEKGKTKLTGWTQGKVGPHTAQCNSMRDDGTMTLDEELAFIEVCRTLKYADPAKK